MNFSSYIRGKPSQTQVTTKHFQECRLDRQVTDLLFAGVIFWHMYINTWWFQLQVSTVFKGFWNFEHLLYFRPWACIKHWQIMIPTRDSKGMSYILSFSCPSQPPQPPLTRGWLVPLNDFRVSSTSIHLTLLQDKSCKNQSSSHKTSITAGT